PRSAGRPRSVEPLRLRRRSRARDRSRRRRPGPHRRGGPTPRGRACVSACRRPIWVRVWRVRRPVPRPHCRQGPGQRGLSSGTIRTMRRLVPWVLVSLVALGAAAGAALGIAHGTAPEAPSQWVAAVLATTERAGTARFSYNHVTSSPNADLRGSLSGHGEVDFVTD